MSYISNANEINHQKFPDDPYNKPYIIKHNDKKYSLCPIDLGVLKDKKFPDICESLFQFHVFFMAWPDFRTPSKKLFFIGCHHVAFLYDSSVLIIEWLTIYVNRKTGEIYKYEAKNIISYKCNKQELLAIENLKKLNPPDDPASKWAKGSNMGASNMGRTEDKGTIMWEFDGSSFPVTIDFTEFPFAIGPTGN